jgi:hypothetical protein
MPQNGGLSNGPHRFAASFVFYHQLQVKNKSPLLLTKTELKTKRPPGKTFCEAAAL